MRRSAPRFTLLAAGLVGVIASEGSAQGSGPGLVVPTPPAAAVSVQVDSFVGVDGSRRQFDVYRPHSATGPLPALVFVNVVGPDMRGWRGYIEWARLATSRGFAAVHYDGPRYDPAVAAPVNAARAQGTLDSVLATLGRHGVSLGVDGTSIVLWAGSANTSAGTPVALTGNRPAIRGYILYYGSGTAPDPRIDVPVFIARAGLDNPALNRNLDSLANRLVQAGVPLTLVNYPAGRHGFDVLDSTAATARVIDQTMDFAEAAVRPALQQAVAAAGPEVRAAAAFTAGRWAEAASRYRDVANARPTGGVYWRLGLAQLENGQPAEALESFARARDLGVGGARDIGLPAARAALRAGAPDRAAEWIAWALQRFANIRAEIAADEELAPLLEHPGVRTPED